MPLDQAVSILEPTSPLYREIGSNFITEWRREFGPAKYFMADSFIESEPPVSKDRQTRLHELAGYGEAVYNSIVAGDPDATWFMQAWLFHYKRAFWDEESIRALLSKVPNDRMVLIDLFNERYHGWETLDGFFGKNWMYSVIHNFGGGTPLTGDLKFYASDPIRSLDNPPRGRQVGFGISPEGVENNEVVYELLTDMMWRSEELDLTRWLRQYARSRYGACPDKMFQAWTGLANSCYGKYAQGARHAFQNPPSLKPGSSLALDPEYRAATKLFLQCAPELSRNAFYKADLIELTAQWAGIRTGELLKEACAAHEKNERELRDKRAAQAFDLMSRIDTLLAAHPIHRLDRWVDMAARFASTPEDTKQYLWNARMQVTLWGSPGLSDYSARLWSGLIRDYYIPRWKLFFQQLDSDEKPNLRPWEEKWVAEGVLSPSRPPADVVASASEIIASLERTE